MAATSSLYGGGVKSVQAGVYSGAGGTITISAVVVAKSVISTVSKSSAGTVASTGSVTLLCQVIRGLEVYLVARRV